MGLDNFASKVNNNKIVELSRLQERTINNLHHNELNQNNSFNRGVINNNIQQTNVINYHFAGHSQSKPTNDDGTTVLFLVISIFYVATIFFKDRNLLNFIAPISILVLIIMNYAIYTFYVHRENLSFNWKQNFFKRSLITFTALFLINSDLFVLLFPIEFVNVDALVEQGVKLDTVINMIMKHPIPAIYSSLKLLILVSIIVIYLNQISTMIKRKKSINLFQR